MEDQEMQGQGQDAQAQDQQQREEREAAAGEPDTDGELLDPSERESFRTRWEAIQATFVDEPKGSVQNADTLVAELMGSVERRLGEQRERLESHWTNDNASTEDLRVTLTRYRSFFDRLLSK